MTKENGMRREVDTREKKKYFSKDETWMRRWSLLGGKFRGGASQVEGTARAKALKCVPSQHGAALPYAMDAKQRSSLWSC